LKSPGKIPGCSPARNIPENLSDLQAQIAANQKGIVLMNELIDCYGLDTVQKYMKHIQVLFHPTEKCEFINRKCLLIRIMPI